MVDAQRNVIISLKLQGDPKNQTIAREIAGQAQFAADAAGAVYRANMKQFETAEAGKTKVVKDEAQKRIDQYAREMEEYDKRRKAFKKKYEEAEKVRMESSQRANEAAVIAVQGMADMVEGAAKIGLVSEDNLQVFMRQYVVVQEGIRVFKGMTDVWWKGREALIALSSATKAQAAANEILAASNVKAAGTQSVGAASAGVTGGGALAGGTALGGAAIVGKVAAVAAVAVAAGLALHDSLKTMAGLFVDLGEDSGRATDAMLSQRKAYDEATEAIKRTTKAEKERTELEQERDAYTQKINDQIDLEGQLRQSGYRSEEAQAISGLDYRGNFASGGETSLQQAERLRRNAMMEARAADTDVVANDQMRRDRASENKFQADQLTLDILKRHEDAYRNLYEADKNRLAVIRSQNKALEDQLKSEKEKLSTLQESKRTEEQSLKSKLGQYNPGLRDRAIEVAEKIKSGGKLDRRDVMIMQEAGVGQEYIDQYYSSQAENVQGVDTFTDVFGSKKLKKDLSDTQQNVNQQTAQLAQGDQQEMQAAQDLNETSKLLQQSTEARIAQEAEMKLYWKESIAAMHNNVKAIQEASGNALDAIHQQGMATINAFVEMQKAIVQEQEDLRKQIQQDKLKQNGYQNP